MKRFSVLCMSCGAVEVTIDDLDAILFEGRDDVQLAFSCPRCADEIRVGLHVPDLYLAVSTLAEMLEDAARVAEGEEPETFQVFALSEEGAFSDEGSSIDHYCEFFRRQLSRISDVEALISEIDDAPR
jgi:hypothetical protein